MDRDALINGPGGLSSCREQCGESDLKIPVLSSSNSKNLSHSYSVYRSRLDHFGSTVGRSKAARPSRIPAPLPDRVAHDVAPLATKPAPGRLVRGRIAFREAGLQEQTGARRDLRVQPLAGSPGGAHLASRYGPISDATRAARYQERFQTGQLRQRTRWFALRESSRISPQKQRARRVD